MPSPRGSSSVRRTCCRCRLRREKPPPAEPPPLRPSPRSLATGTRPAPRRGAGGWVPRKGEAEGAKTPEARGSERHEAGLRRPPGTRRRRGQLRPERRPSESAPGRLRAVTHWAMAAADQAGAERGGGPRRRLGLSPAVARLPRPRPRLSGAGQSEGRGGAVPTRHWPSLAPVTPPEANGTPPPGAASGERRAHR